MELQSLRSQLQHACPDLRNLTNAELEESKWITKKKVFINLISCSRLLDEQNDALADLNEERNAESSFMKREGTSREVRLESETAYRTKFMRIVLSALTRLRWPPSQEAFSDPLDSLFNDASAFQDAALFLVKMVLPSASYSYKDTEEAPSALPSRPKSGQRRPVGNSGHFNPFDTSMSTVAHETSALNVSPNARGCESDHARPSDSMISSFGYEQTSYTPRSPFRDESQADHSIGNAKERKQALNWKAFEMLQRQNELLSVRLRELQLSVLKRDEAEGRIAGMVSELKATVAEIVDAGSVGASKKGPARPGAGSAPEGFVLRGGAGKDLSLELAQAASGSHLTTKEQEMEAFRLEAEREKEEELSMKEKSLGITQVGGRTSGKPPVAVSSSKTRPPVPEVARKAPTSSSVSSSAPYCSKCSGAVGRTESASAASTSGVIWSKLHARLSALEAQWGTAQRAARTLAEGSGSKAGSPPPRLSKGGSGGSGGVLYSAQSTPSRGLVSRAYGVQPSLISSAADLSFSSGGAFGDVYNSPPQPPSRQPHLAGPSEQGGLDLARVHLLQRDLVYFAERAFAWTSESLFVAPSPEANAATSSSSFRRGSGTSGSAAPAAGRVRDGSLQHPASLPLSDQAARRQQEAQALQLASWDLLLHLAALGPVVPLALDSPLKSSMTGLEALIHETSDLAYPKISKAAQIRLQTAADRALAEQVATIRCWRQTRSCLSQWTAHAARVAPTLKMLGRRHRSNVEHAAEDLAALGSGLSQVVEALAAAEAVRIRPAGDDASMLSVGSGHSARSGVPIAPLDSLARGSAGKEVAALVNALRAHKDELGESAEIVRALGVKLAAELKRDLEVVGSTESNLLFAADLSENVLESAQPEPVLESHGAGREARGSPNAAGGGSRTSGGRPKNRAADGVGARPSTLASRPAFDLSLS